MNRFLLLCAAQNGLDTDRYQWSRQVQLRIFLNLSEGFPHIHGLAVCTHTRTSMRGFMYTETAVSNVSWLRFSRIMKPLPQHFPLLYVLHLMESTRIVYSLQLSTLRSNLLLLSPSDISLMTSLIDAYCWETYSLDHVIQNMHTFDCDLLSILYQFTKVEVACKESL